MHRPACTADTDDGDRGASDSNGDDDVEDYIEEAKKEAN